MEEDNSKYSRQVGIINPDRLTKSIFILGAGSIGSWTTLALAKLGCSKLTVMDFDKVGSENTGSQIYDEAVINRSKVEALSGLIRFYTSTLIEGIDNKYNKGTRVPEQIIISATDNMASRRDIFETHKGADKILIDARMAGNQIQIYTLHLNNPDDCIAYESNLFTDEEADPAPCSERSVVYNCFIVAGLIADLVAKIANEEELPFYIEVDLKNLNLFKDLNVLKI